MGNTMELNLEQKEGYIGIRQLPKVINRRGDREIRLIKLLFLIRVDKGKDPPPGT